jgi:MPBQ/MSBQ methyltransferase
MTSTGDIDIGLKCLHQVFELKSLHYGLFEDDTPRTPEGVHQAQANYRRALIGLVPEGAGPVLDVGAGLGDSTKALVAAGFEAEGLSPDPYHQEQFRLNCGPEIPFHLSRLEDFSPGKAYGCLLFGESPQYIDKDRFFPKCVELTRPDGCVVVAELFQHKPGGPYATCFFEEDFLARAERAGFRVDYHRDITEQVLPTLEVGAMFLDFGRKLFDFARDTARRRRPILTRIGRLFYGRKLEQLRVLLHEKAPAWLDTDRFRQTTRYAMYRFVR